MNSDIEKHLKICSSNLKGSANTAKEIINSLQNFCKIMGSGWSIHVHFKQ